ncbi:MAG: DNA recombination protein RmuC [Chitinivibrionia bacterium]|nr:DNA recombination protein RmuC [Chitinivibrionia bacterium]
MTITIIFSIIGTIAIIAAILLTSQQIKTLEAAKSLAEMQRDDKQEKINELEREKALLYANLNVAEERLESQKIEIKAMQESAKNEFKVIANEILKENTKNFNEHNADKLNEILNPLRENLGEFKKKVEEAQTETTKGTAELKGIITLLSQQSRQIGEEAKNLAQALKGDNKVQGDWGEVKLKVLLDKLGFEENIHYRKQNSFKGEGSAQLRPDFIINLPENKHCIIDCKVSLTAYERYFNSEDKEEKEQALKEHIKSVNNHIKSLSGKRYEGISEINSPDFVFMFVPIEAALALAVQNNPTLIEDAAKNNVMLMSATTLLFALRTVAYILNAEKKVLDQNRNVKEIARIGGEIYEKFVGFATNMEKIGNNLGNAQTAYDAAMGQLTKKNQDGSASGVSIVGKLEVMKKLGIDTDKQISQNLLGKTES